MTMKQMRTLQLLLGFALSIGGGSAFAQAGRGERLLIPYLDSESQSNVIITVSDVFGEGQLCPPEYTNRLSNENLFTPQEQKTINDAFTKYRNVTTNSGPKGTVLSHIFETNHVVKAMNREFTVKRWVARFQYTNSDAYDEVTIGKSLSAKFRNKSGDGYDVFLNGTGEGTLMDFRQVTHELVNGPYARFVIPHAQGEFWDYRLANFANSRLQEYRRYTNGMVVGKVFMWNVFNGNLTIEAEFKKPYDWRQHYLQPTRQ